jgi:hypothetical protein
VTALGDRALEDVLGGPSGGWFFWLAFLTHLAECVDRSRDREGSFCSFPDGELRRVVRDLEDALALATTAVAVQQLVNEDPVDVPDTILDVLERRVQDVRRDRERA